MYIHIGAPRRSALFSGSILLAALAIRRALRQVRLRAVFDLIWKPWQRPRISRLSECEIQRNPFRQGASCCTLVVKIGGSAITDKGAFETLDYQRLQDTARHLALRPATSGSVALVHGAGSFGHFQAGHNCK